MHRKKAYDWSHPRNKAILIDQRRFLWYPESIAMFAAWAGLRPGMTVADVGCGLGYMGKVYWPHFGGRGRRKQSGSYLGIDITRKLLPRARKASPAWAQGGSASFMAGDVCRLPLADNSVDCVMCQTLLMHLPEPQRGMAEMARVLKPGGIMICHEPDNLSSAMVRGYDSLPQLSIDDELFLHRVGFYRHAGRIKLGCGDSGIGAKVPKMMSDAGLRRIGIRMNDKACLLLPPYEDGMQRQRLRDLRRHLAADSGNWYWRERDRRELLAGGGSKADCRRYCKLMGSIQARSRRQVRKGLMASAGGCLFYIIKGVKPLSVRR